jgi:hypothetical protein
MATNTVAALDAAMKTYYKGGKLVRLAYEKHPWLAMVNKVKSFPGRDIPIVPWYAGTGGQSRTFATAQANATAEATAVFSLRRKKDYAVAYIDMETLLVTTDDDGAFLKAGTDVVENTNRQASRNLGISLYRNYGGARGKISSGGGGATITLVNPGDIVNFEVGMKVVQAQTDGTSGALEADAAVLITKVDRQAGTITSAGFTGFDNGNFLFREGDFGLSFNGLQDWIPSSVASNDSFLGVNRSTDSRLRGLYVDATANGFDYIEALEYTDAMLAREGASPDVVLCNPMDLRKIKTQMGAQIEYDLVKSSDMTSVTFKSISFPSVGGAGELKLVADPDCPEKEIFMLQKDSWVLRTVGEFPRGLEGNGFKFLTSQTADAVEVRVGGYGNLGCFAPDKNGRISFA